jgi:hypothetical protein
MRSDIQALADEVKAINEVVPSVLALLEGVADKLDANRENVDQIRLIARDLRLRRQELAEAVAHGTAASSETPAGDTGNTSGTGGGTTGETGTVDVQGTGEPTVEPGKLPAPTEDGGEEEGVDSRKGFPA